MSFDEKGIVADDPLESKGAKAPLSGQGVGDHAMTVISQGDIHIPKSVGVCAVFNARSAALVCGEIVDHVR